MKKGIFFGVSVGPGDSQLMTIKAVKAIEDCPVIAVPITPQGNTMALDIVKEVVDISQKEIIYSSFAMTRDREKNNQNHIEIANTIIEYLEKGKSVAMLSIGDISIFSTFSYIMAIVEGSGYECQVIAGVPSFCAVAAQLKQSLTAMKKPLTIIPGGYDNVGELLDIDGTKIIMKSASKLNSVIETLNEKGLNDKSAMVQNCGLENEKIVKNINDEIDNSYFTTILVKE